MMGRSSEPIGVRRDSGRGARRSGDDNNDELAGLDDGDDEQWQTTTTTSTRLPKNNFSMRVRHSHEKIAIAIISWQTDVRRYARSPLQSIKFLRRLNVSAVDCTISHVDRWPVANRRFVRTEKWAIQKAEKILVHTLLLPVVSSINEEGYGSADKITKNCRKEGLHGELL
uniref:Uncharacterized protein n=1 Tax=Oryza nivara TaxID=4536 RepID=A0A0E0FSF5_ORYNI